MYRNNENYKRLLRALHLSKNDVHEIMAGEVSKSQIDGWSRNEGAVKHGTGTSQADTVRRFRPMSDEHFDLFCTRIIQWVADLEKSDDL